MVLPSQGLSVLFLEDSEEEISIVYQKLADDLCCPIHMDTAAAESRFLSLLKSNRYDFILADYMLPGYNAPFALEHTLAICPETPFIIISGTIGEDIAVEMLKKGAADFVLMERLGRLPIAVMRALEGVKNAQEKKQAEQQLMRTVLNLEEAQKIAHIGSCEWTVENDTVVWSDEVYRIFGLDPSTTKLHRRMSYDYMDEQDKPVVQAIFDAAKRDIKPFNAHYWITRPDGNRRYINFRGDMKTDPQGRLSSMSGTMQDITERKLAEMETNQIKESLKEAQRIAHIGSWEWDIVADKLYWSDESYRLLGMEPSSAPARRGLYMEYMIPGDKERVVKALDWALKNHEQFKVEYCINAADGKMRHIQSLGFTQYNDAGQPVFMTGTMQDITERKLAEMEILKTKENLEEAQRIAHIGSSEWDLINNTIYWSDEAYRMLGLDPKDDKISRGVPYQYMSEADRKRVSEAIEAMIRYNAPYDIEYTLHLPDKKTLYIHARGLVRHNAEGKPATVTVSMQDITERKLAEEKARRHVIFEETIRSLSQDFINMPAELLDGAITAAIGLVGEYCKAERASMWLYDNDGETMQRLYEWDAEPGSDHKIKQPSVPFSAIPGGMACCMRGEPIQISSGEDFAEDSPYRLFLEMAGVKSICMFPLMAEGKAIGAFIYSTMSHIKTWDETESIAVSLFCQMLTSVLRRKEQDSKLRELNENYRLMLDSTNDGVVMFDRSGVILNINKNFANRFGGTVGGSVGLNYKGFLPEELHETLAKNRLAMLQKAFDTGEPVVFEDSRQGMTFNNRFYPVFKDGRVAAVTLFSTDITVQKRASEESRRHTDFQQVIALLSRDFINMPLNRLDEAMTASLGLVGKYCGFDRTSIWRYDWENGVVTRLYGWDGLADRPAADKWDTVPFFAVSDMIECHKSGRAHHISKVDRDVNGKATENTNGQAASTFPLVADGRLYGNLSFCSANAIQLSDTELSAITIFSEMIMYVLQRKEQEEILQNLNDNYGLILDSINDDVAMFSRDDTILNINRKFAQKFDCLAEDVIGMKFRAFFPDDDVFENRLQKIREVARTGMPMVFEDSRNGAWFSNRLYPVFADNQVSAVTLFATDITDRKAAADEAKRRLESEARLTVMTEFFTNVSHELKTPLSLILMQMDMMRMHTGDTQKMQSLIADITLNTYRLTRLVSNLLDITKMDAGFLKLNHKSRDIVTILKNICDSVNEYAMERKISLAFATNAQVKYMDVDSDKLERAVLNLLSNAIKHTQAGGSIHVKLKDCSENVIISVQDTGEGIPMDKITAVFDRFVQVNNKLSRQTEGCGIGLALVKSMVELHGGSVWAESEPGRGSTFFIALPVLNMASKSPLIVVDGFDLNKKVKMELSDLYIKVDA